MSADTRGESGRADVVEFGPGSAGYAGAQAPVVDVAPRAQNRPRPIFDWWLDAGVPFAIFAATRVAQIVVLAWMLPAGDAIKERLLAWDAGWFIRVATEGYPHGYSYGENGALTGNDLAFFPFYPWLVKAGHVLGMAYDTSALAVASVAATAAAFVVYALVRKLAEGSGRDLVTARRAGYAFVGLCFAQPMSIVFTMGYSESIFLALVAGMLLAAYTRWWVLAGVLGALAGLTRPTGAAAAVALGVAAFMCLLDRARPVREKVTAVAAAVVALAAVPAYIAWVGRRVGDMNAWFNIQTAGWGTTFDYGKSTWSFLTTTIRGGDGFVAMSVVALLLAATAALAIAVRRTVWLPLTVYGVIVFVLVVGQAGFFHSKPRLLVPALLVLLPAAFAAARARPRVAVLWVAVYGLVGLWYGAYMLTVWHYAI